VPFRANTFKDIDTVTKTITKINAISLFDFPLFISGILSKSVRALLCGADAPASIAHIQKLNEGLDFGKLYPLTSN
jgi:hypothetical protein